MLNHHRNCPKLQFWDSGESVPCECPRGWPQRDDRERIPPKTVSDDDYKRIQRELYGDN